MHETCCVMWQIKLHVCYKKLTWILHPCRKICKNCLCPREEHDINEDTSKTELQETHVGKILFSPSADTLTRKVSGDAGGRSPRSVSPLLYHNTIQTSNIMIMRILQLFTINYGKNKPYTHTYNNFMTPRSFQNAKVVSADLEFIHYVQMLNNMLSNVSEQC